MKRYEKALISLSKRPLHNNNNRNQ